jgi:Lrp/AsnC family transcriptional regulator, regulator for asnA, asnC and gidA
MSFSGNFFPGGNLMLDMLDKKLIMQLQVFGRLSYVDLAKLLQVTERTVRSRMEKLMEKGIIRITALPNLDILGFDFTGIVGLQVESAKLKSIMAKLAEHPNICYVVNITGEYHVLIIIVAKSVKKFTNIMENFVSPIPGILKTESWLCLSTQKGDKIYPDTRKLIAALTKALSDD